MKGSREFCKDSVVAVLSETPTQPRDDDCKDLGQFAQVVSCLGLDTRAKRQRFLPMDTENHREKPDDMHPNPGGFLCRKNWRKKSKRDCARLLEPETEMTWSDMVRHGQTWSAGVDLVRSWIASSAFGSLVLEGRRAVGWSRMFFLVQLWLPEILLTRKSMERLDTPEKIENDRKPMKPLMLIPRHEAYESVYRSWRLLWRLWNRASTGETSYGSPPTPDWLGDLSLIGGFGHWPIISCRFHAIPTISNHSMGSFAIEEFWTLSL